MEKIDFKKQMKQYYNSSSKNVEIIKVPKMNFLMIEGKGDPNTSKEFKDAIETLYPVAYNIKFKIKKEKGIDYGVLPLEGLWWVDDMKNFSIKNKEDWKWIAMIMQPEFVTKNIFKEVLKEVEEKKNPPAIAKIVFEPYHEGSASQIMHIGPFATEGPTIATLHRVIMENGYKIKGKHHEIYLSDFRKVNPEKMKTIIRQPFKK